MCMLMTAHTFLNNSSTGPIRSKKSTKESEMEEVIGWVGIKKTEPETDPQKKIAYIGFG